jgi:hypothetical protein
VASVVTYDLKQTHTHYNIFDADWNYLGEFIGTEEELKKLLKPGWWAEVAS